MEKEEMVKLSSLLNLLLPALLSELTVTVNYTCRDGS